LAHLVAGDRTGIALDLRLRSLTVRAFRNADRDDWQALHAEAVSLANAAESAGALSDAAMALATAGDLLNRLLQTALTSAAADLRILGSLGHEVPLAERIESAKRFVKMSHESMELYRRAFDLADRVAQPLDLAQIDLSYSRYLTFMVMNGIWQTHGIDDQARATGERAISHALRAADTFAKHGAVRNMVIGLNEAAEAASALNDRTRLEEFANRASEIASKHGYRDLVTSAKNLRAGPTVLEYYQLAKSPPPFHHLDPAEGERYIDELIRLTRLSPDDTAQVRPVLQRELTALEQLDTQREEVCKYLALIQDLRGPKIGPFNAVDPTWNVICRMRGLAGIAQHRKAKPLLQQFVSAHCWSCEFRAPAAGPRDFEESEQDLFAPLLQRIAAEDD